MPFTENHVLRIVLILAIAWPVNQASNSCIEKISFVMDSTGGSSLEEIKLHHMFRDAEGMSNKLSSKPCLNKVFSNDQENRFNGTDKHASQTDITLHNVQKTSGALVKYRNLKNKFQKLVETGPRKAESSRFFFFKGIKKLMWTVFIGLQIVKTVLLALFLPSILGSLGKMVGKVSGINQQSETVNGLNFRDTALYQEEDGQHNSYKYPQSDVSSSYEIEEYSFPIDFIKPVSRLGIGDHNLSHVNSAAYAAKNYKSNAHYGIKFETFSDIPASSLLLSNYDPFYSPLLSRLDAVFQQFYLQKSNEACREKLVCYMYSNPTKYAPYSNLVSAQLSRELHELQKPAVGNPQILRFFKYMKAAKEGQEGVDCEAMYKECIELKDALDPVMVTAYKDINKLVQARDFRT